STETLIRESVRTHMFVVLTLRICREPRSSCVWRLDRRHLQASDSIVATPQSSGTENLGLKQKILTLACAFAATVAAQTGGGGGYLGPGVLSRGAGDIGRRAGQEVDLRFFASAYAIYDTGIQPFSLDSSGKLLETNGL